MAGGGVMGNSWRTSPAGPHSMACVGRTWSRGSEAQWGMERQHCCQTKRRPVAPLTHRPARSTHAHLCAVHVHSHSAAGPEALQQGARASVMGGGEGRQLLVSAALGHHQQAEVRASRLCGGSSGRDRTGGA